MAKKHENIANYLLPEVHAKDLTPPRDLPFNIGTLLLPRILKEIGRGAHIDEPRRLAAHAVFKTWIEKLSSGQLNALTETQVEGDFTGNLLTALGYQTHGDAGESGSFTMLPKYAIPGAGIADVALGVFSFDEAGTLVGKPKVVVELKGAGVDLDKRVGGRTPVEQAWVYLNACESASWALVSNFAEIRLYHRKGSNYVFRTRMIDLADLREFEAFYSVLHAEALLETGSFSYTTSWVLEQTEQKQETVGEELYREYYHRRKELIDELTSKGYEFTKSVAAAQKLLDRILFIAFAEDRGLLDSSGKTLEYTANQVAFRRSRWNNFQSLFEAIDLGDPESDIPQYNGELFKTDEILDNPKLKLDPKWPNVFKTIGKYDFKDEVTEAVLGRIFELSIEDIEKLKQEGLPDETDAKDRKSPGKRKLHGVFYTHAAIVDYLVNAALQPAYEAERARLAEIHKVDHQEPNADFVRAMIDWLDTRTVLDPACGSGAFLSRAYNWFEDRRLELLNQLRDTDPADPLCAGRAEDWRARSAESILKNNLYGVDLSGESVEIARLSLWIRTARRDQKLTNLSENVTSGNSVVSDPEVDPRAFDWRSRFPRVFANGGFDAVIGNPPYVRQEHLGPIKEHLQAEYQTYHGMADLYVYFYERGLSLLKPGGRLAYVVTNKWMKAGYGEPLRKFFAEQSWVESVIDFGHAKQFFRDADVFPCFLVARKPSGYAAPELSDVCMVPRENVRLDDLPNVIVQHLHRTPRKQLSDTPWQLESGSVTALLEKLQRSGKALSRFLQVEPYRGILTGLNGAFMLDQSTKERITSQDARSGEVIRPYLRGQDIKRWSPQWGNLWMITIPSSGNREWPWSKASSEAETIFANMFPSIYQHLCQYKAPLEARQDKGEFWWELRSCAYWQAFDRPKIVFPEITWHQQWCLDNRGLLLNNTAYIIDSTDPWILAVMNSPVAWWYAWRTAVHGKDEALRFIKDFVQEFPCPPVPKRNSKVATQAVDRLVHIVSAQQSTMSTLLDWLKIEFEIDSPNTKLQNPISLESDDFVKEVKKARGKSKGLSAPQLKKLREEYLRTIQPARVLADEVKALELQIHDLVNEAYGLTPEEVRLMWDTAPPRMPIARPPGV